MPKASKSQSVNFYLKNMGLRPKLITFYLASILIPLLIFGGILYAVSMTEIEAEMRKMSFQSVKQVNIALDEFINQIDTISLMPYTDLEIEDYLINTSGITFYPGRLRLTPSGTRILTRQNSKPDIEKIQAFLNNLIGVKQDIDFMSIVSLNEGTITKSKFGIVKSQYDFFSEPIYNNLRNSTGEKVLTPVHKADYLFAPSKNVFSLGRKIFNFNEGVYTGYILIDCDAKVFDRICSEVSIGKSGYIFIVDKNGDMLYSSDKNQKDISLNSIKQAMVKFRNQKNVNTIEDFGTNKMILVSNTSYYSGWTTIGILPYEEVLHRVDGIKNVFVYLSLICIFLVFVSSILISRSVSRPIRKLQKAMKEVEKGNTDIRVSIHSYNEIGELSQSFNQLLEKINSLLASIKSIEIKKHQAELESLKSQINPHFLYNTLESIRMIAVIDDNKDIADATEALGNLFRYSVRQRKDIVDVRFELQHAKNYILLQKIRYGDKFDVIYDIDEEVLDYKTLKFSLQPIVENAIYHGIEKKRGKGVLKVIAHKVGDDLQFEVVDDGAGIQLKRLIELREDIVSYVEDSAESIGLKNVNQRVNLYFGQKYGLSIDSVPGEGTSVKLTIPAFNNEEWVMGNVIGISGR